MAHFEALGLYYKKMVVVLPKCVAIRVKIAFISGTLKIQVSILFAFFSTSLKSKSFASKGKALLSINN